LHEAGIIKIGPARPGDQHRAQGIEPDFVGVGGELVAVVAITGGVGDDALAGPPRPVERRADIGQGGLAAAGEDIEIEREGADIVVRRGCVDRPDHFGEAIFAGQRSAAQSVDGAARRGLLDDRAGEVEPERPAGSAVVIGAGRERGIHPAEEEQQEQKDERVLHPDQEAPHFAQEFHFRSPRSIVPSARPATAPCKRRGARPLTLALRTLNPRALALAGCEC
jgi:hypothetical protein